MQKLVDKRKTTLTPLQKVLVTKDSIKKKLTSQEVADKLYNSEKERFYKKHFRRTQNKSLDIDSNLPCLKQQHKQSQFYHNSMKNRNKSKGIQIRKNLKNRILEEKLRETQLKSTTPQPLIQKHTVNHSKNKSHTPVVFKTSDFDSCLDNPRKRSYGEKALEKINDIMNACDIERKNTLEKDLNTKMQLEKKLARAYSRRLEWTSDFLKSNEDMEANVVKNLFHFYQDSDDLMANEYFKYKQECQEAEKDVKAFVKLLRKRKNIII